MKIVTPRHAAILLPVLALTLSGCSILDQTQIWYHPADGVSAEAGDLALRNVVVVSDVEETAPSTLLVSVTNNGDEDDALVAIGTGDSVTQLPEPIELPAGYTTTIGEPSDLRADFNQWLLPGSFVDIELIFQRGPSTEATPLVQEDTGYYEDVFSVSTVTSS